MASFLCGIGPNATDLAHFADISGRRRWPGSIYHAVDEEGMTMKAIVEAHARGLKVLVVSIGPDQAEAHFGWLAHFEVLDKPSPARSPNRS